MLNKTKDLIGFSLGARDGEIGRVKDLYFDDHNWTVRHLVADTGKWLPKRAVLISPFAVREILESEKTIAVDLTKGQIEKSPPVEEDKPVSRQMEEQYYRYYGWPYYWHGPYVWGPYPYPRMDMAPMVDSETPDRPDGASGDPHLRSAKAVRDYHIQALDAEFGHVEDFVFDDEDWVIRYLIVDTRNWWPGKQVLLPPQWLDSIDWNRSHIRIDLDRETIKRAPEYDPGQPITRAHEEALFSFYSREPYWISRKPAPAR